MKLYIVIRCVTVSICLENITPDKHHCCFPIKANDSDGAEGGVGGRDNEIKEIRGGRWGGGGGEIMN